MDVLTRKAQEALALLSVAFAAGGCDAIVGVDFGSAHLAPDAGATEDAGAPPVDAERSDGGNHDGGARDSGKDARTSDARAGDTGTAADGGCPASATPRTNPCVLSTAYGVFVAPVSQGGSDQEGTGSELLPYASIGTAMMHAHGKRIYVCAATYTQQLVIGTAFDGVQIYGGLACPGTANEGDGGVDASVPAWSYTGVPALIAPIGSGYVLDVEGLVKGAHFEDLDFRAAATSAPSSSSIAVLVDASMNLSFDHIVAEGGDAAGGAAGGMLPSNACTTSLNGASNTAAAAGMGPTCLCPLFGSSTGGDGKLRLGATSPDNIGTSTPATSTPLGQPGANGDAVMMLCAPGEQGQNGASGAAGNPGLTGTLTADGWSIMPGGAGMIADPGQGGGGGGANENAGASGGAGGCGGNGGLGGGGGGASIAIALVDSDASFTSVTLTSAAGGPGGAGGSGEAGQAGGLGGVPNPPSPLYSCAGGPGGTGGTGGGGGGGAGGPSVGIAWTGTPPTIDGTAVISGMTLSIPSGYTGPSMVAPGGQGGSGGTPGGNGPQGSIAAVLQL